MKPILIAICIVIVALVIIAILFIRNRKMHKTQNTIARAPFNGRYELAKHWKGFDLVPGITNKDWSFFLGKDPTNGSVNYVDNPELIVPWGDTGPVRIYTGRPYGNANNQTICNSIRIQSTMNFDHGLFIMRLKHIPERDGTWPAWWLNGITDSYTTWACRGEIDIIEGMNYSDNHPKFDQDFRNTSTLHTNTPYTGVECTQNGAVGVSQPTCNASSYKYKTCGCSGKEPCPDLGCSIRGPSNSFGRGFNTIYGANGGGAFVCELTPDGQVSIWFFDAYGANKYLTPLPDNTLITQIWPIVPYARFNRCPGQFANLQMIIDTTICGDWWSDKSCQDLLDKQADERIDTDGYKEETAYWDIESISVYQQQY